MRKQHNAPVNFDLQPAIERLKAIAEEAGKRLLLADGPPHPDADLLDLCGDALYCRRLSQKAEAEYHTFPPPYGEPRPTGELLRRAKEAHDKWLRVSNEAVQLAKRASKIRAATPAGIYAKALLVRTARSAAAALAQSLAEDLVSNPTLRASLWPAEPTTERGRHDAAA